LTDPRPSPRLPAASPAHATRRVLPPCWHDPTLPRNQTLHETRGASIGFFHRARAFFAAHGSTRATRTWQTDEQWCAETAVDEPSKLRAFVTVDRASGTGDVILTHDAAVARSIDSDVAAWASRNPGKEAWQGNCALRLSPIQHIAITDVATALS